jgi:hypothetical protein
MKKITAIILILIISGPVFSQQSDTVPVLNRQYYFTKSDNQKKAAKILLVGGAVISGVGFGIVLSHLDGLFDPNQPPPRNNGKLADVLGYGGLVIAAASIPLFIASSKNEKKAMSMSLDNQIMQQLQGNNFVYRAVPVLKLKISF